MPRACRAIGLCCIFKIGPIAWSGRRVVVFEEDLEWDSPANLALLQSISRETKGQFLTPEELPRFFREFRSRPLLSYQSRREVSIWDKWPFLLLFVCVLSVEWILRKRTGYA